MKKYIAVALGAIIWGSLLFVLPGCGKSNADVAAHNLSVAAEQFEIPRQIIAFNGITDKYIEVIQGFCSVETTDSSLGGALQVTCKVQPKGTHGEKAALYYKEFVGLSDNISYTVHQLAAKHVSISHYRVIFKPEVIVPNFDRP